MKFNKPVYALLNTKTNQLLAPTQLGGKCWFRGLYDNKKSAKLALIKLYKTMKDLIECGYDVPEYAEYIVVEINETIIY